jgi:hypothetical protein
MADPYTIRIFVPDGNPEGLRIIDQMNWTGRCIALPREEPAKPIGPIPYGNTPSGAMQGPRYTTRAKLQIAKTIPDIFLKE